jgi:magnesium transporter
LLRDYQDPGTPPGTLRPGRRPERAGAVIVASYSVGEASVADVEDGETLGRLRGDGRVHWIHVIGLGDVALIERLGKVFDLHALALEDVLTLGQRPKTEAYDETIFCISRVSSTRTGILTKTQLSMFLGSDFVLTFQAQGEDFLSPVRDRIAKGPRALSQKVRCYLA